MTRSYQRKDGGAALLAVLFLVAVMSVAGLAILEVTGRAITRAKLVDAQAQSLWFVAGADEVGKAELGVLRRSGSLNLTLSNPVLTTPYVFVSPAGGTMTATLRDGSNCFNVNSVVTLDEFDEKVVEETNMLAFRQLLQAYDVPEGEAEALTDALIDWIDDDRRSRDRGAEDSAYIRRDTAHRTSGQLLDSISELRTIIGFEAELVTALEPIICARPSMEVSSYNINTMVPAQAALISAAFGGEVSLFQAAEIIDNRPLGGWSSIEDFMNQTDIAAVPEESRTDGVFTDTSNRLILEGTATIGDARQNFTLVYSVATDTPVQTVRRIFGEG